MLELLATPPSRALLDVAAERRRQVEAEGWSLDHDLTNNDGGTLVQAAVVYALAAIGDPQERDVMEAHGLDGAEPYIRNHWPQEWAGSWFKPKTPRRDLVRAAALLLAEIERRDTVEPPEVSANEVCADLSPSEQEDLVRILQDIREAYGPARREGDATAPIMVEIAIANHDALSESRTALLSHAITAANELVPPEGSSLDARLLRELGLRIAATDLVYTAAFLIQVLKKGQNEVFEPGRFALAAHAIAQVQAKEWSECGETGAPAVDQTLIAEEALS